MQIKLLFAALALAYNVASVAADDCDTCIATAASMATSLEEHCGFLDTCIADYPDCTNAVDEWNGNACQTLVESSYSYSHSYSHSYSDSYSYSYSHSYSDSYSYSHSYSDSYSYSHSYSYSYSDPPTCDDCMEQIEPQSQEQWCAGLDACIVQYPDCTNAADAWDYGCDESESYSYSETMSPTSQPTSGPDECDLCAEEAPDCQGVQACVDSYFLNECAFAHDILDGPCDGWDDGSYGSYDNSGSSGSSDSGSYGSYGSYDYSFGFDISEECTMDCLIDVWLDLSYESSYSYAALTEGQCGTMNGCEYSQSCNSNDQMIICFMLMAEECIDNFGIGEECLGEPVPMVIATVETEVAFNGLACDDYNAALQELFGASMAEALDLPEGQVEFSDECSNPSRRRLDDADATAAVIPMTVTLELEADAVDDPAKQVAVLADLQTDLVEAVSAPVGDGASPFLAELEVKTEAYVQEQTALGNDVSALTAAVAAVGVDEDLTTATIEEGIAEAEGNLGDIFILETMSPTSQPTSSSLSTGDDDFANMPECILPCMDEDANCDCNDADQVNKVMANVIQDCYVAGGADWDQLVSSCGLSEAELTALANTSSAATVTFSVVALIAAALVL